jgi:hypothetical protein
MKILSGIIIIGIATFISFIIANIPTEQDPGLGGLILWFWPPTLGIVGMAVFLIACAFTKSGKIRLITSLIWATYLVYVGLGLHFDKGWPLVYW